jgi:hypothetical protein
VLLASAIFPSAGLPSPAKACQVGDVFNYYYAIEAARDGINPYDRAAVIARFGHPIHFVYPPYALPVFLPLALFDFPTARLIYFVLQLGALAGLVFLVRRLLPIDWRLLALLLPAGLGGTLLRDLCGANTVIFESLLLWLAIAMLWRGRAKEAALALFVAALPKLLWLALLPLLLLHRSLAAWRNLAIAGLATLALWALWLAVSFETFWRWLVNVRVTTGFRNNLFTMLRWLDEAAWGGAVGGPLLARWEAWGYGLWLALVGAVFVVALRRQPGLRTLSLFALLSLLAVWPGNGLYSFVPVLPIAAAVIFFLAGSGKHFAALALAGFCLLPEQVYLLLHIGFPYFHVTTLMVLAVWAVFAILILRQRQALEAWLTPAKATH